MAIAATVLFVLTVQELKNYEVHGSSEDYGKEHNNSARKDKNLPPKLIGIMLVIILAAAGITHYYYRSYEAFNVRINPEAGELSWEMMLEDIAGRLKRTHNTERGSITGPAGRFLNFEVNNEGSILDIYIRLAFENKRERYDTFQITKSWEGDKWAAVKYVSTDGTSNYPGIDIEPKTALRSLDNIPWQQLLSNLSDAQSYLFETEDVLSPSYVQSNWEKIWGQNIVNLLLIKEDGSMVKLKKEEVYQGEKYMFFIKVTEVHPVSQLYRTAILLETADI